jgi:hypothetical protein
MDVEFCGCDSDDWSCGQCQNHSSRF